MKSFRNILGAGSCTVALDLGADATRLLVLAPAPHIGWRSMAACVLAPIDLTHELPQHVAATLAERVRELGLRGAACRVTISTDMFRADTASLPSMSDDELCASARFEAQDRFGVEPSEYALQHVPMHTSGGGRGVLLLAASKPLVRRAVEAVVGAGMMPMSVEHAAIAALRGIERWHGESQVGLVACLHVEPRMATLSLLQDGCLWQMRCMKGDWNAVASAPRAPEAVSDAIPLEPIETASPWRWSCLAEETLRCLRQSCGEQVWPARMVVSGPCADDTSLLDALHGVCGVCVAGAGSGRWGDGEPNLAGEAWASAMGAASLHVRTSSSRRAA